MRSPWQLIKSLTSSRKAEETNEPADEVVLITDPRGKEIAQDNIQRGRLNAVPVSVPAFLADDNEPSGQSNPPEAESSRPGPVAQVDPLPSKPASDDASLLRDRLSPAAPVLQATEPELIASAAQEQNDVTETTVIKRAAKRPEVARKTFLEEVIEQDREINDLRLQLSAKLLEQNRQLRRMLDRYNK